MRRQSTLWTVVAGPLQLGVVSTLPSPRPLLDGEHPHVRQAARTAIENLEAMTNGGHMGNGQRGAG